MIKCFFLGWNLRSNANFPLCVELSVFSDSVEFGLMIKSNGLGYITHNLNGLNPVDTNRYNMHR